MTTFTEADRRKILESLTSEELATFQEAFTVFDKNHDGTITTKVNLFILISLNQQGTITTKVNLFILIGLNQQRNNYNPGIPLLF